VQKANSPRVFKSLDWQQRLELICRSNRQIGHCIPQIGAEITLALLAECLQALKMEITAIKLLPRYNMPETAFRFFCQHIAGIVKPSLA
jgi:hypothetical protein